MRCMTTSQRVPRRALLRRIGPWVVLAATLTGCASPAARTALSTLQDGCDDLGGTEATCETLDLITGIPSAAVVRGSGTAALLTSSTGGSDASAKRTRQRETRPAATPRKARPRPDAQPRPRREAKPRRVTRRV